MPWCSENDYSPQAHKLSFQIYDCFFISSLFNMYMFNKNSTQNSVLICKSGINSFTQKSQPAGAEKNRAEEEAIK